MRNLTFSGVAERLLFTAIVVGFLMAAGGAIRYFMLQNQLAGNMAAQVHEQGGEVAIESKGQAQGLMASDIERRRLVAEQFNMMILGGVGLALLGLGWLGHDVLVSRRRRTVASAAQSNGESSQYAKL